MRGLIDWYETRTQDPRIVEAVARTLDWMWDRLYFADTQSFCYLWSAEANTCTQGAPDLNMLYAPAFAWIALQTGDPKYVERGDKLFEGGVKYAYLYGGKQYNQNYRWSVAYVRWRTMLREQQTYSLRPAITTAGADHIEHDSAVVRWSTSVDANGEIEYGLNSTYGKKIASSALMVKDRAVQLRDLFPGTVYHFRVRARIADGTELVSGDKTFTTWPNRLLASYSFDEGSGTAVSDTSGNRNNGVLVKSPAWIKGRKGMALQFNGTDAGVSIPNSATLTLTPPFSASFWVKPSAYPVRGKVSVIFGNQCPYYGQLAALLNPGGTITVAMNYSAVTNEGVSLPLDTWSHIALVFDETYGAALYVNGVLDGKPRGTPLVTPAAAKPLNFGACISGMAYNGAIDEFQLYGRHLRPDEIASLAEGVTPIRPTPKFPPNSPQTLRLAN